MYILTTNIVLIHIYQLYNFSWLCVPIVPRLLRVVVFFRALLQPLRIHFQLPTFEYLDKNKTFSIYIFLYANIWTSCVAIS